MLWFPCLCRCTEHMLRCNSPIKSLKPTWCCASMTYKPCQPGVWLIILHHTIDLCFSAQVMPRVLVTATAARSPCRLSRQALIDFISRTSAHSSADAYLLSMLFHTAHPARPGSAAWLSPHQPHNQAPAALWCSSQWPSSSLARWLAAGPAP